MAGVFLIRRTGNKTTNTMKTSNKPGQLMREARRRKGLTQLALAQRVGCTESLVTKIETGRATPEHRLKEAIACVLGIHTWEVGE